MKRKTFLLTAVSLFLAARVFAATVTIPTGGEWFKLPEEERSYYLMTSLYVLYSSGIDFKESPNYYHRAVETMLIENPELFSEDVVTLVARYLYVNEPGAKRTLDSLVRPFSS